MIAMVTRAYIYSLPKVLDPTKPQQVVVSLERARCTRHAPFNSSPRQHARSKTKIDETRKHTVGGRPKERDEGN